MFSIHNVEGSFIRTVVMSKKPVCKNTTLNPFEDTICSINVSLDFYNKYYVIVASYKEITEKYNLRR